MVEHLEKRTASAGNTLSALIKALPPQRQPMCEGSRWERRRLHLNNLVTILRLGFRHLRTPAKIWKALCYMERGRRQLQGEGPVSKVARVEDRYFWDPTAPGFPSRAMEAYYRRALNEAFPFLEHPGLRLLYLSITKKCTLCCRHCYEWKHLNRPEQLTRTDLIEMVRRFQEYGVGVIYLEGGEPLQRLDDILALLDHADDRSDFWIITSGLGLTEEKAQDLKRHGLTGVAVSLDHWQADQHNAFRGNDHVYDWALRAVLNANKAGLVTMLSLCTTREMAQPDNLRAYMELARRLGVSFVQWLEPKAVGRFAGKDVLLSPTEQQLLEEEFNRYNLDPAYRGYPLVLYPARLQRRWGCPGAGHLFLYVDSNGEANACPYCQCPVGSALQVPVPELVRRVRQSGCSTFAPYNPAETANKFSEL